MMSCEVLRPSPDQYHDPRHRPGTPRPPDLAAIGVVEGVDLLFPFLAGDADIENQFCPTSSRCVG